MKRPWTTLIIYAIIFIVSVALCFWIDYAIANSELPLWAKFMLLR